MNKILNFHSFRQIIWRLVLALMIALPASLAQISAQPHAGGGGNLIPFLSILTGWHKRNKLYRTANSFIKEKAKYYDSLREKAREQLADREMGGLRNDQVAAYTKVVALIERERDSMFDFAESEKKAARETFINVIQDEIESRMLASTPATRVLGALTEGIQSSQNMLSTALDKLAGGDGGVLSEIQKVRRIAGRMTIVGQLIGGNTGKTIRDVGIRIVQTIDKPTAEIQAGIIQVQGDLGDLGNMVSDMQNKGYAPAATELTKDVVITLVTGEEADPAIAAIIDMLVAKSGGGGDFRDRARDIQEGNVAVRCAAKAHQIAQVIDRMNLDVNGEDASDDGDQPPCQEIDLTTMVESTTAESQPTATEIVIATSQPEMTNDETDNLEYEGTFSSSAGDCASSGEFEFYVYANGSVIADFIETKNNSCPDYTDPPYAFSVIGTHKNGNFEATFKSGLVLTGTFDTNTMSCIIQDDYVMFVCSAKRVP